jgi:hypothetical protein
LNLANCEREEMQMRTLSPCWASKPLDVSTQLGIPRSQGQGEVQIINGESIGLFENGGFRGAWGRGEKCKSPTGRERERDITSVQALEADEMT